MQHMTFDSWCEIHMADVRETCQRCKGTGICPRCGDYQICSSCGGSGDCRTCDGEGAIDGVECHRCHGKSYCIRCDGEGVEVCETCEGSGECPECGTQALRARYRASCAFDREQAARWADGRGLPGYATAIDMPAFAGQLAIFSQ